VKSRGFLLRALDKQGKRIILLRPLQALDIAHKLQKSANHDKSRVRVRLPA
jgi:hypothetical protein